jgi:hypothetical protein
MLATMLATALATSAVAESDPLRAGVEFSGFNTYWVEKPVGCQPMISFRIRNISPGDIGPIGFRMEVVDKDNGSVFANGTTSVPALPQGGIKEIAIGGDHDITLHDCLGDMHEAGFSTIHFAVRLTATAGQDSVSVEIMRDEAIRNELMPATK